MGRVATPARVPDPESAAMAHWLMKTEPGDFSIDDLARVGVEPWTGVRNYQARNLMRDRMHPGDGVLFYHSSCAEPGIAGLAEVASEAYPDPTQFDRKSKYFDATSRREEPRWMLVDVRHQRSFRRVITLAELKTHDRLAGMVLLQRGSRLSVQPVTKAQWDFILTLE
jgi:predicted RNA-binding protein with PUA-like domain